MPSVSDLTDLRVIDPKGKVLGTINFVLFHPDEMRAVGIEIRPRALGYVVERKPQYFALDALEIHKDHVDLVEPKAASGASAERRLGFSWDDTVIWSYHDVWTTSGTVMGQVVNIVFDKTGAVRNIKVSDGATADIAIGRYTVEAEHIIGFDGAVIRVENAVDDMSASGGLAAQAGKGAAVAKYAAAQAGDGAIKATVTVAKAVKKSKTAKRAKKGWGEFKDAFKEGARSDDD